MRVLLLAFFISSVGYSQNKLMEFDYLSDKLSGHRYLDVGAIFSMVSDNKVPNPEEQKMSGWTVNVQYDKVNFDKGGYQYTGRIKMFLDVIFLLDNALTKDGSIDREVNTGITSGILGWHSFRWNVVAKDKFCLGLGVNASDYFYGASYKDENEDLFTPEPNGYYLGGGPTLSFDYRINDFLKVGGLFDYTFSAVKAVGVSYGEEIEGYPLPHFFNGSINLTTKWGVFLKYDFNTILNTNNATTQGKRSDFWIGFKFVLR